MKTFDEAVQEIVATALRHHRSTPRTETGVWENQLIYTGDDGLKRFARITLVDLDEHPVKPGDPYDWFVNG
jgi:hypothetical protein